MITGKSILILAIVIAVLFFIIRKLGNNDNGKYKTININGKPYKFDMAKNYSDTEDDIKIEQDLKRLQAENKAWEREFASVMEFQSKGIECEKNKEIDNAIAAYERAIENGYNSKRLGINNYLYSIERVVILYRRTKQFEKEISIIQRVLNENLREKDREYMINRLEKSKSLLLKQQGIDK